MKHYGGFQSTTLGVLIRHITGGRYLRYTEEVQLPREFQKDSIDEKRVQSRVDERGGGEGGERTGDEHDTTDAGTRLEPGQSGRGSGASGSTAAEQPSDGHGGAGLGDSNDPTAIEQETTLYAGAEVDEDQEGGNEYSTDKPRQEDEESAPAVADNAVREARGERSERSPSTSTSASTGSSPSAPAATSDAAEPSWPSDETVVDESMPRGNDTYAPDKVQSRDPNLVDWYSCDDPECPYNWPTWYKCFVSMQMAILTFAVYAGGSIYTAGISGNNSIQEVFDVSLTTALVGLTVFILGYGISPMVWSPLSEIPRIGRMPIYVGTLAVFLALQFPTIYAPNIQTLLVMRFFAGWCGGPAIAIGGATMGDMFRPKQLAYALGIWSCGAVCGPHFGPLLGGFAFQANGWQWPLWVLTWLAAGTLLLITVCLPETSWKTILYRRTMRLRRLTGNQELKCQAMKAAEQQTSADMVQEYLIRPVVLCKEPTILIYNIYLALIYGLLNLWFESFPMVFRDLRGFNPGQTGLCFLGLFVGAWSSCAAFCIYFYNRMSPVFDRNGGVMPIPESRLRPAPIAAFCVPIAMFGFGWTGQYEHVHWIVPIIFTSFFGIGSFILFQTIFSYLSDTYPKELASVFTINDLFRSSFGAGFPLFAHALFLRLGIGGANSLLGGLACLFIPAPFLFLRYGHRIRAASKWAAKTGL